MPPTQSLSDGDITDISTPTTTSETINLGGQNQLVTLLIEDRKPVSHNGHWARHLEFAYAILLMNIVLEDLRSWKYNRIALASNANLSETGLQIFQFFNKSTRKKCQEHYNTVLNRFRYSMKLELRGYSYSLNTPFNDNTMATVGNNIGVVDICKGRTGRSRKQVKDNGSRRSTNT